jgi:hypothetical protein
MIGCFKIHHCLNTNRMLPGGSKGEYWKGWPFLFYGLCPPNKAICHTGGGIGEILSF